MRNLLFALSVFAALAIGFFLGLFSAKMANPMVDPKVQARLDSLAQDLTDSIAVTEAWLQSETAEYIQFVEDTKARVIQKFGYEATKKDVDDWSQSVENAKAGRIDFQIQARRHIDWMKQELAWLKAYPYFSENE